MGQKSSWILFVALFAVLQAQAPSRSPPQIIEQPPTNVLLYQVPSPNGFDRPLQIECEAEGEPAPDYRWTKDGKSFEWLRAGDRITQLLGRGTLEIRSPRDEDSGQYQCFAENEHGIATSNSVFVRKAELNEFKEEPVKTVVANEGEPLKLECQPPYGWPRPHAYWLIQRTDGGIKSINNSRMTVDPDGNLWFSSVSRYDASDDFYYVCAVSSNFLNKHKLGNRVLLNVFRTSQEPKQIQHAPIQQYVTQRNKLALRGKKAELFCIYGGTPLPQIIWKKDGRLIEWNDRISQGNFGKSLIIKQATFVDRGSYTCDLSNGVGEAQSHSIELSVTTVPFFFVKPEIQNVSENETVEFRCVAGGAPEPVIEWIHNGKPISESPANSRRTVSTNTIVISRVSTEDTGNYGCNASNSFGYVYKDVYLNVRALVAEKPQQALSCSPLRIIKQPPNDELLYQVASPERFDRPLLIKCEAEGEPAAKYRWSKDGKPFEWLRAGDRISQQPGRGTLEIKSPRDEDAGQYQCFAENEHGIATSNSVFVRQAKLNEFKEEPVKTVVADEGEPLKLECQPPDGWPKPQTYWLIQRTDGGIKSINNSRMTLDPEGNLWFSSVSRYDASDDFYYVCAVTSISLNEYKLGNRVLLHVVQMNLEPKQIQRAPTQQYVTRRNEVALRGKKVELFCIYGGTPLPQIIWKKDGHLIEWNERISEGNFGKSLIIKNATFEDRGSYTCDSSNGVGEAQSHSIELNLMAAPYFTVEPEIQNAPEDGTVEFRCEAGGVPEPVIDWIHNGRPISESPASSRRTVSTNSIIIRGVSAEYTGNYGCNATNSLGYVYKDVYLNVRVFAAEVEGKQCQRRTTAGSA